MLAQRYEREREPLPALDPIEAIKFRMDQQGLSRKDLLGVFVTTARVSEVLIRTTIVGPIEVDAGAPPRPTPLPAAVSGAGQLRRWESIGSRRRRLAGLWDWDLDLGSGSEGHVAARHSWRW